MFIRKKTFLAKLEEQRQAYMDMKKSYEETAKAYGEMKCALGKNTEALTKAKTVCIRTEELLRLQHEVLLKEAESRITEGERVDAKQIVNEWFYGEEVAKEVAQNGSD